MRWTKVSDYCIESDTHYLCKFAQGQKDGSPSIWHYEVSRKRDKRVVGSRTVCLGRFPYGPARDVLSAAQTDAYKAAVACAEADLASAKTRRAA